MNKYRNFDNESGKESYKLSRFLHLSENNGVNRRIKIEKIPAPYSTSPYRHIVDFSNRTKIVCSNVDLSVFLDPCKVIFVGDSNCGETSLIKRIASSSATINSGPLDINYESVLMNVLGLDYQIGLWNVPGSQEFSLIARPYYENCSVVVVVIDLTQAKSLPNVAKRMRESLRSTRTDPIRFLVGTKGEMLSKSELMDIEVNAKAIAEELDAEYFQLCSFSSGKGYEVLLKRFSALAFEKSIQKLINPDYQTHARNNLSKLRMFEKGKKQTFWRWITSCLYTRKDFASCVGMRS